MSERAYTITVIPTARALRWRWEVWDDSSTTSRVVAASGSHGVLFGWRAVRKAHAAARTHARGHDSGRRSHAYYVEIEEPRAPG